MLPSVQQPTKAHRDMVPVHLYIQVPYLLTANLVGVTGNRLQCLESINEVIISRDYCTFTCKVLELLESHRYQVPGCHNC